MLCIDITKLFLESLKFLLRNCNKKFFAIRKVVCKFPPSFFPPFFEVKFLLLFINGGLFEFIGPTVGAYSLSCVERLPCWYFRDTAEARQIKLLLILIPKSWLTAGPPDSVRYCSNLYQDFGALNQQTGCFY